MKKKYYVTTLAMVLVTISSQAQGIIDGYFKEKGHATIAASYTISNYTSFYLGNNEAPSSPVGHVNQHIYSIYANYGITDNLQAIINLPYIDSKSEFPDPINGEDRQSDLQDLSLAIKWRPLKSEFNSGHINYITALGVNVPLGYEPNGILSNGSGALAVNGTLGLHFQSNSGFFSTITGVYSYRGEAKDNLNLLSSGNKFDVPNAILFSGKIGFAVKNLYLDAWIDNQTSTDGVDIGGTGFAGNFPETKVNYTRLGANTYIPFGDCYGISAGFGTIISGRNVSESSYFTTAFVLNL